MSIHGNSRCCSDGPIYLTVHLGLCTSYYRVTPARSFHDVCLLRTKLVDFRHKKPQHGSSPDRCQLSRVPCGLQYAVGLSRQRQLNRLGLLSGRQGPAATKTLWLYWPNYLLLNSSTIWHGCSSKLWAVGWDHPSGLPYRVIVSNVAGVSSAYSAELILEQGLRGLRNTSS